MTYKPCIVIPCYNHAATIPAILRQLESHKLDCLVIDDGSNEENAELLEGLNKTFSFVTVLRHDYNQGKGGAVMTGLRAAWEKGYSHAIQIDADGQHQLDDLPTLCDLSEKKPEGLISGRPIFDDSIPKSRFYGRYVTHVWVWIETLSTTIKDSMCGFRAYPLEPCVKLINEVGLGRRMDFDIEIMVRLYWRGVKPVFFDTRVVYPEGGSSHFRALEDNCLISWMHTKLFFGMLVRLPKLISAKNPDQSHWSRTRERGTLFGLKFMLNVYRLASRSVFNLFLYPVMTYFWLTGRLARKASTEYLERITEYSSRIGKPLPESTDSFKHFIRFGQSILDKVSAWNGDIRLEDINFPNIDLYRDVVSSKNGVLVIGSHLGNLELCRALGEASGDVVINAIVYTDHAEQFNRLLREVNPKSNVNLVQVSDMGPDTAIMLEQKISAGEWIVIVADRTPLNLKKNVSWVDFLGSKAAFPQGPFILASLLKCPVYLMFGLKEKDQYTVHFELFAERISLPRAQRAGKIELLAQNYAQRLENYCLAAPLEWFNFYDFWKGPDEEE